MVVGLVAHLVVAGDPHLSGIDHDHEVAHVEMGREIGAVLPPQEGGDPRRQTAQRLVSGIDDVPLGYDLFCLDAIGLHRYQSLRPGSNRYMLPASGRAPAEEPPGRPPPGAPPAASPRTLPASAAPAPPPPEIGRAH